MDPETKAGFSSRLLFCACRLRLLSPCRLAGITPPESSEGSGSTGKLTQGGRMKWCWCVFAFQHECTHTHFSKHPEACVCAHMCYDGWFCCSEPLKAPCFPLGGFSCRRVGSGERLQLHLKTKLKYDAFKL